MEKPSAYRGDEPYIFVCYAHEDAEIVYPEIAWLQAQGVNVWYDEGISLGTEWTQALADAIQGCSRFLFFVTPNSVTREHCRRELNFAQEGRDVLAVHLQLAKVPGGLRLSLNNRQAIFKHEMADEQYHREVLEALLGAAVAEATMETPPPSPRGPRLAIYVAAALLIAVAGAWWFNLEEQDTVIKDGAPTARDVLHNSIAVLPFDNLSPDPDNAYFAAGIHEEILNQLSKIEDLSVIARATMARYANSDKSVPEIGTELEVSTVMDGSVRYAGNRVRITTQLIDATSGAHLWSEAYEENLEDIFGIQLAIATRIADTLEARFSPAEQARIANRTTASPVAYAHYLDARSRFANFTPTAPVHEAIDAALAIDSDFAVALAYKAFIYGSQVVFSYGVTNWSADSPRRFATLAEQYARQALELDDQQASAHHAMHFVHVFRRDWGAAMKSIERAHALQPNDPIIAAWTGYNRAALGGDMDAGIELTKRAISLSPGDVQVQSVLGTLLSRAQRWEEAVEQARLIVAMLPNATPTYGLGLSLAFAGDIDEARQLAQKLEAGESGLTGLVQSAHLYGLIGDTSSARRVLGLVEAHPESGKLTADQRFRMHMELEEYAETAIETLETIVDENSSLGLITDLHAWHNHPAYEPIRSHPKFHELVRRVSAPIEPTD